MRSYKCICKFVASVRTLASFDLRNYNKLLSILFHHRLLDYWDPRCASPFHPPFFPVGFQVPEPVIKDVNSIFTTLTDGCAYFFFISYYSFIISLFTYLLFITYNTLLAKIHLLSDFLYTYYDIIFCIYIIALLHLNQ